MWLLVAAPQMLKRGLLFRMSLDMCRDILESLGEVSDVICYVYTVNTAKLAVLKDNLFTRVPVDTV